MFSRISSWYKSFKRKREQQRIEYLRLLEGIPAFSSGILQERINKTRR